MKRVTSSIGCADPVTMHQTDVGRWNIHEQSADHPRRIVIATIRGKRKVRRHLESAILFAKIIFEIANDVFAETGTSTRQQGTQVKRPIPGRESGTKGTHHASLTRKSIGLEKQKARREPGLYASSCAETKKSPHGHSTRVSLVDVSVSRKRVPLA